jgi:nicotinamide mononucleotide transporter
MLPNSQIIKPSYMLSFLSALSWVEIVAVLAGIVYVVLSAQDNIWCWSFGILNALLSIYLFYHSQLYAESFLYVYYVLAGIYGWYSWGKGWGAQEHLAISAWKLQKHAPVLLISEVLSLILGYILAHYTDARYPWMDAHTTLFSFAATFLSTRKVLENWIYWIIIDAVSIGICWGRELYFYAFLMVVYTIMAYWGWRNWKNLLQKVEMI